MHQILYLHDYCLLNENSIKVFIDFKNAYDSVNIAILLSKLSKILDINQLKLIGSLFLKGKIVTNINGKFTSYITKTNGLFQGSILSPILFNFYVNDICHSLNDSLKELSAVFYADDLLIVSSDFNIINSKLSQLQNWCNENNIRINLDKSAVIGSSNVHLNQLLINEVDNYKYLGINFVNNGILYDDLLTKLEEKTISVINISSIINNFLNEREKIQIFKTYILPFFNMYSPFLYFLKSNHIGMTKNHDQFFNELNLLLSNWIFNGKSKYYSVNFSISGLLKCKDLFKYISCRFKHKFLNSFIEEPINYLILKMKDDNKYNYKSLVYRIINYNPIQIDQKFYSSSFNTFLNELNRIKSDILVYGKTSKLIRSRCNNRMDKLLKFNNEKIRSTLIKWRNNKIFLINSFNNGYKISRISFNEVLYPIVKNNIKSTYVIIYNNLIDKYPDNYTIVDYLINASKYEEAYTIIQQIKGILKNTYK